MTVMNSFTQTGLECLLGSRLPTRERVTNLPSISDPSLDPRITDSFSSMKTISRIPRCDHCQLCLRRGFGKPNYVPVWWEPLAFPGPLGTRNCWEADASFSLFNKGSEESQDKVTFRLWGSPCQSIQTKCGKKKGRKKKERKAIIWMLNSWIFGKPKFWRSFKIFLPVFLCLRNILKRNKTKQKKN